MTLDRHAASHPITQSTPQSRPRRPSRPLPCHRRDDANLAFGATRHRDRTGGDRALGGPERRPRSLALDGAGVYRCGSRVNPRCTRRTPKMAVEGGRPGHFGIDAWARAPSNGQAHRTSRCRRQPRTPKWYPTGTSCWFSTSALGPAAMATCRPFEERARRDSNSRPSVP
jgi:hypothetical protein